MALQSIFDRILPPKIVTIETDDFETIEIDSTVAVNHRFVTEVTEHEVEEGFDITDNIRRTPAVITISGVITDTPNFLGSNAILTAVRDKPSQNAFDFFKNIYDTGIICYVDTKFFYYDTYVMKDFNVKESVDESGGLFFDLEFHEVRFATAEEGEAPDDLTGDDKTTASKQKKKGVQKPVEATAAQKDKSGIILGVEFLVGG